MVNRLRRPGSAVLIACLCWLVSPSSSSLAADQPRLGKSSIGFSLSVRPGRWAPLKVRIENPGPATDAILRACCVDSGGARFPILTDLPIHLPAESSRTHTTYVRMDNSDKVEVELYCGGNLSARETVSPAPLGPRESLFVSLTFDANQNFSCRQERETPEFPVRFRFNNTSQFSELPTRWQGYDAADVLAVGSLPPEGINPAQEQAIVDWVRAGGLLILCPGGSPARWENTLIEQISPVQRLGARLVQAVPPIEALYGPIPGNTRIGLTESTVRDGRVLLQWDQFPLIVTRNEGVGKVVFVAFDLANERLTAWPALRDLYADLIIPRGRIPSPAGSGFPGQALTALNEMAGVKVLGRWVLAVCVIVNLAVTLAVFILLRKRREAAFAALLVIAPLMAVAINLIGSAASGIVETTLAGVHVVQTSAGQAKAAVNSCYALLSPSAARVDVCHPGEPSAFPDALLPYTLRVSGRPSAASAPSQRFTFTDTDIKRVEGVEVRPRSPVHFQSSRVATPTGAIEATATCAADGIRFDLVNKSKERFSEGFVAANRNVAAFGALAPGQKTTVTLATDTARGMLAAHSPTAIVSRRQPIVNSLFAARDADLADTGFLACAWAGSAPDPLSVNGLSQAPVRRDQALWVAQAAPAAAAGRILIPKGAAVFRPRQRLPVLFENGRWGAFSGRVTFETDFEVPAPALGLKPTRIDFFLATGRALAKAAIEVFNWQTGAYDIVLGGTPSAPPPPPPPPAEKPSRKKKTPPVSHFAPSSPRVETAPIAKDRFALPDPEKHYQPEFGRVRLRVTLEAVQPAGELQPASIRRPVVEDFDIEIEGTRE
ncbi:MAG TPA: hypothetical protein P5137_12205 [Candidatus Brocadiia bacterium]|nr:hypothetical protein [Candidatus Brocadiia bacterium]